MKKILASLLVLFAIAFSSATRAQAVDCAFVLNEVSLGFLTLDAAKAGHPECFPSSGGALNQQSISATVVQQVSTVSSAVVSRFTGISSPGNTQLSLASINLVGGNSQKWFIWGNGAAGHATYNTSVNAFDSRMNTRSATFGGDYLLLPNLVLGLSTAFDNGNGLLRNGRSGLQDSLDSRGFALAPYAGWQISPTLTLDAMIGRGWGHQEQDATNVESDRHFTASNLTFTKWLGNLQILGKGGYLYAEERFGDIQSKRTGAIANSAVTSRLNQIRLGGQIGYWISGGIMPYVGLAYSNDVSRSASDAQPWDPIALVGTLGLNLMGVKQGIAGGIAYTNEFRREGTNNHTIGANLNVRF